MNVRGRVGQERTMAGDRTAYAIGADLTAVDGVKLSVERNSGYFVGVASNDRARTAAGKSPRAA